MDRDQFHRYYDEWKARIRNQARKIARGDLDLADDLAQEAFWKLSEFDTTKIVNSAPGYLWRTLYDHMLFVYRRERRARRPGSSSASDVEHVRWRRGSRGAAKRRRRWHMDRGPLHEHALPELDDDEDELWERSDE